MVARSESCDLLLLNASNYPRVPIFPYAFVQVSEIARRHGLRVEFHDLLGTPPRSSKAVLERLLRRHRPRAIGLHVRQTDSLLVEEYRTYGSSRPDERPFLPVEETERIVKELRELCSLPVLLGGHGFTSNARGLFDHLKPDLAVVGEPDGLFERWADVLAGRHLETVPNLLYRRGDRVIASERHFFPPSRNPEYTPEIVDAIKRFYGERFLHEQTFPVEVMRGCPYRCYFCVEPAVKGREARIRNLDAVMEDIELLASHGLGRIWLVCSELNVFGPDLALELAGRIAKLQEKLAAPIRWYAFSLPARMGEEVWRTLARSGFRGGFNTFMSLDDENLKKGRIPHRAIDAVEEYKNIETIAAETGSDASDLRARGTLALFLGNAFATIETVSRSLALLREHGVLETARVPLVLSATRVFEVLTPDDGREQNLLCSFGADGAAPPDVSRLPTFEYPKALLDHFGDRRAMDTFFTWVQTTLLSRGHESHKSWPLFLANVTQRATLLGWLRDGVRDPRGGASSVVERYLRPEERNELASLLADPDEARVEELFFPSEARRTVVGQVAQGVLLSLFERRPGATASALRSLGFDGTLGDVLAAPVFDVLEPLYRRFESNEQAVASVPAGADEGIATLVARFVLYKRNVVIEPKYRPLLFVDEASVGDRRPVRLPVHVG
jgi:hypothetical protein